MVCICVYVVCFSLSQLCLILIKSILKEIYAPKLQEFAYVTDGACSEEDILRMELAILKVIISLLFLLAIS